VRIATTAATLRVSHAAASGAQFVYTCSGY